MVEYFHSVTLIKDKCTGCTNCIKQCPTEAIRVRDRKARIIKERCIDCGKCIQVCPHHAKTAVTDPLTVKDKFKYSIALPAPTLYGQFKSITDIGFILNAIKKLGFDEVYETTVGADIVSAYTRRLLRTEKHRRPLISSACPAIVRLVQVRFPELVGNLVNLRPPVEIAAKLAREEFVKKTGCKPEEVGVFFISPCPAKMTAIHNPLGNDFSYINGVISIIEVYGQLALLLQKPWELGQPQKLKSLPEGIGWAAIGGEGNEAGVANRLAVDGIDNVIKVMEEIENGKLNDLQFFEGLACKGGCVGGALTYENNYIAKMRIEQLVAQLKKQQATTNKDVVGVGDDSDFFYTRPIPPNPVMKLDEDIQTAIKKIEKIDRLYKELPGLDCGSCGSPSCRCMAEDIVRGYADEMDCIFKLKERVKELAKEMVEFADKLDK